MSAEGVASLGNLGQWSGSTSTHRADSHCDQDDGIRLDEGEDQQGGDTWGLGGAHIHHLQSLEMKDMSVFCVFYVFYVFENVHSVLGQDRVSAEGVASLGNLGQWRGSASTHRADRLCPLRLRERPLRQGVVIPCLLRALV